MLLLLVSGGSYITRLVALLTEPLSLEMTGVGVWIAEDKLRVGDPTSTYFRLMSKLPVKGDFEVRDLAAILSLLLIVLVL